MERLRKWIFMHPIVAISLFSSMALLLLFVGSVAAIWLLSSEDRLPGVISWLAVLFYIIIIFGLPSLTCWIKINRGRAGLAHHNVLWSIPWQFLILSIFSAAQLYTVSNMMSTSPDYDIKVELRQNEIVSIFLSGCMGLLILLGWAIGEGIISRQRRLGRWKTIIVQDANLVSQMPETMKSLERLEKI